MKFILFSFALTLLIISSVASEKKRRSYGASGPTEKEILEEYKRRGHKWPIRKFSPNTPGWKAVMNRRLAQIRQIANIQIKYVLWRQALQAAVTMPNYTEHGWGLTRVNDELIQALVQGVEDGLPTAKREWESNSVLLIDRPDLTNRVLEEMKPVVEAWTGIKLIPYRAVGFRIHRNNATSLMHWESPNTHVVGCVIHIASSPTDAERWPVAVEDFEGNTNLVHLTSGDAILLESSKVLHGRPIPFTGNWTTSLYAYYVPDDEDFENTDHEMDAIYAMPPIWRDVPEKEDDYPEIELVGMALSEPSCPHQWCALKEATTWQGPAESGYVLTTGNTRNQLNKNEHDEL